jgi:hypothetical protein
MGWRLAAVAMLAAVGCSGSAGELPAPSQPEAPSSAPAETAKPATPPAGADESIPKGEGTPGVAPPFSAEQIRDATHPGRRYLYSVQNAGRPAMRFQVEFLTRTDDQTSYRVTVTNARGQQVSRKEQTETWAQLEAHAEFPPEHTKMSELTFKVPAGSYQGYLYETRDPAAGLVTRLYFAADLPGAALKVEVEDIKTGVLQRTMELLEHQPGTPQPR